MLRGIRRPRPGWRTLLVQACLRLVRYYLLLSHTVHCSLIHQFHICRRGTDTSFFLPVRPSIDYKIESSVSGSIYVIYAAQTSFYLHSVYATLFLDAWRKDSFVLLLHHVITAILLCVSWSARYVTSPRDRSFISRRVTISSSIQVSSIGTHHDFPPRYL